MLMPRRLFITAVCIFALSGTNAQSTVFNKDSLIAAVLSDIKADSVGRYIQDLQDLNNRFALTPGQKNIALVVADMFQGAGLTNVRLDSFLLDSVQWPANSGVYYSEWQYNVIGELTGQEDPTELYVMGAHYDAIVHNGADAFGFTPGADDNASGVAAMVETARVFAAHGIQPDHTIHFVAFAGEELYLHGSDRYSQKLLDSLSNVVLMINNDMIAHNLQAPNDYRLRIQKYPGTDWIETMTQALAAQYTSLTCYSDSNVIAYSDSYPFHLRGYDAVFYQEYDFFTSLHTVSDITDSLDMDYCAEMVKVSAAMLLHNNLTQSPAGLAEAPLRLMSLYPNPATGPVQAVIHADRPGEATVTVYDASLRAVRVAASTLQTGNNNITIDIGSLPPGLYTIAVNAVNTTLHSRIIKL